MTNFSDSGWRLVLAALATCSSAGLAAPKGGAQAMIQSGVGGGLVVHVGCGDGKLTAALHAGDSYLVHGLDTNFENVAAARRHIRSLGLCGKVTVDTFDGKHLPYVDNLVNLLVADDLGAVAMAEVMRVLAPGGVAMIGGDKTIKSRSADIDEWTHFLHDSSGNAVSADKKVGPPRRIQWTAGPQWTRDHDALASMSAMTTSSGRVFYIFDEGPTSLIHRPARWKLIARDAFNGVLLWKRDIPKWLTALYYFRSGPAQLPRRLVSVGDRVYVTLGLDAPVAVLNAATGKTLYTLEASRRTEEILVHKAAVLTVQGDPASFNDEAPKVYGYWELSVMKPPAIRKSIVAYDADTGKVRWRITGENMAYLAPLSLAAKGDRVVFLDNRQLHCVRLADGKGLWQAPFETKGLFLRNYTPTVVVCDEVAMCMTYNRLQAFSMADGRKLWGRDKGAMGYASPGDLFIIDGLAWIIPQSSSIWKGNRLNKDGKIVSGLRIPLDSFLGNGGREMWGIDIHTGEVKRRLPMSLLPGGHHHRCFRNKATERYLICGRRGLEYVDLAGENHVNNWWVRGLCQYGVMPANGYIYVPPDPCQCFNQIKVNGFLALAKGSSLDELNSPGASRLEKGPALVADQTRRAAAPPAEAPEASKLAWHPPIYPRNTQEWPTYRGNITRSGSTRMAVGTKLTALWKAPVGSRLSAPVLAGNRLFVCDGDAHTVHCLDARKGSEIWRFQAGGRVDSPPTIHDGLCVFGCSDGWVYCLRADSGQLAWRRRLAPVDRRIVVNNRLESVWPIHGSVLVQDGVVYAAAGRSTYLDGGIRLFGLDVYTGRTLHEATLSTTPGALGLNRPPSGGALPDVMISDGTAITMRYKQFDMDLKPRSPARIRTLLTSPGLLEDSWEHRQPWRLGAARAAATSRAMLIVFDAKYAYGVMDPYTWLKATPAMWPANHNGHMHQKYSRYSAKDFPVGVTIAAAPNRVSPAASAKARRSQRAPRGSASDQWSVHDTVQPRAMVLARDVLFLAGWRDALAVQPKTGQPVDPADPDPRRPFLRAVAAADGKVLAEYPLDCDPVFDGLAAAYGRLYVSLNNGSVVCMGPDR